jgi:hypothetical protein
MKYTITKKMASGKALAEHCAARGIPCVKHPSGDFEVHCGDELILAELLAGNQDEDTFVVSKKRNKEKAAAKKAAVAKSKLLADTKKKLAETIADATLKAQEEAEMVLIKAGHEKEAAQIAPKKKKKK